MGKWLVITEKPSVARDIAAALGGFEEHDEYMESDAYVMTWAIGHLLELAEPQDYDKKFRSWSISNLPIIPDAYTIKPRDGQKTRLKQIEKLGKRKDVDGTINACDAGREGELIYRRTVEFTGLDDKPSKRLWLQSMTHDSIRTAFSSLRPGGELDPLASAAWLRAVGDWLIGMNATRALTQRLKSRGEQGAWSAGRVQTPTLNLLVQRELEILAHEPRPYWEIVATFALDSATWEGRWFDPDLTTDDPEHKPTRIFDADRAQALFAGVQKADVGDASETRKKSKEKPPLPFDLTTLQREANRRFSFSAKRTLDAAQRLYEGHKLVTYPRTDSRHLPEDYGETLGNVLGALQADVDYAAIADGIVREGPLNLERILDNSKVSDHFAIVPTGNESDRSLSPDDARIYDLIVRQFLASLMGPATWATVERVVVVSTDAGVDAHFRTRERTLEIPGFHAALRKADDEAEAPIVKLPPLVAGQDKVEGVAVEVHDPILEDKETRPPGRLSEAQILRMMEMAGQLIEDDDLAEAMVGKGLGTPATRADTIEGLVRKQYARRTSGKLAPTSKAMRLMDILARLDVEALAKPELTGDWEYTLGRVAHGELDRSTVLASLEDLTRSVTASLTNFEHENLYANDDDLGLCPACGEGQVQENAWGYPCSRNTGKDGPCRFMVWKDRGGRFIDRKLVKKLVADRVVGPIGGFFDRSGREIEGTLHLEFDDEKERWTLRIDYGGGAGGEGDEPEEIIGKLCPDPDDSTAWIIETNKRYISERVLNGDAKKGPVLPKVVCHREMTPEEATAYFSEEGKTPTLESFISRRGRPFKGALFRKPTGKHGFEFPPREPRAGSKASAKKSSAKKAATKKTTAKKAASKKTTAKKTTAKKATSKKTTAKKTASKKTTAKKAASKKTTAKKAAKKSTAKKTSAKASTSATGTEA